MANNPKCPHCGTNEYVVLKSTGKKVGTVVGAGVGLLGANGADTIAANILARITGATVGGYIGSKAGKMVDENIICTYTCNKCGKEFEG